MSQSQLFFRRANRQDWAILACFAAWWAMWVHIEQIGNHHYEAAVTRMESSSVWQSKIIEISQRKGIDDKELLITALTLFGSAKRPGETYLDNNIQAQMAVLDSARNRAKVCRTSPQDELLKWGYSKKENRYRAMYSVWENGGPRIGYTDIERFGKALAQARKVILLSRATRPDERITHYHQAKMKSPPEWSKLFRPVKDIGGNSFYQETLESGAYCKAFVPKAIPIPVKIKPRMRKKKGVVAKKNTARRDGLERIRVMHRKTKQSEDNDA